MVALPLNEELPLNAGLPAEQMSPGRRDTQRLVALPTSYVQVGSWLPKSQLICHLDVT